MDAERNVSSRRVLEPIERVSEVLFGLIMVLTFTGSLSAATADRAEVRTMLFGAIGCNLAWGLIDAIMYLMGCLADRAAYQHTIARVQRAETPEEARAAITHSLPAVIGSVLSPADLDRMHASLSKARKPMAQARLEKQDWLGAAAVFLLVFASTMPVVAPFVFVQDPWTALRISNAIAVLMMLITGYAFGRLAGYRPWLTAGSMVLLGCLLVTLTIELGG